MRWAEKDRFFWTHREARILRPFFNLVLCECPHCRLAFTCLPPEGYVAPKDVTGASS